MSKILCSECDSKLREYSDGLICQKNHKFAKNSKLYIEFNEYKKLKKANKHNCPMCGTKYIMICMCSKSEMTCSNGHLWTAEYYRGDKRYFLEKKPEHGHVFDF